MKSSIAYAMYSNADFNTLKLAFTYFSVANKPSYLLTKISSALSYYSIILLCSSSLKCPSNDMVPFVQNYCTDKEKKNVEKLLQFLGFSRSKCFGACSIIFLSPQSVVIVSSLHYNHIIKKAPDGQLTHQPWAWEQRTCLTF